MDHAPEKIRINAVSLAPIRTEMYEGAVRGEPELEEYIRNWVPLGHVGASQDVANAVSWLVSDKAEVITGQSLALDGGTLAGFN